MNLNTIRNEAYKLIRRVEWLEEADSNTEKLHIDYADRPSVVKMEMLSSVKNILCEIVE